jgi:hypothetical protein
MIGQQILSECCDFFKWFFKMQEHLLRILVQNLLHLPGFWSEGNLQKQFEPPYSFGKSGEVS